MALIAWEERESLVTDITLVKLLGILNVNTFDVFFPLVVGLKKLLAKRAWQSWSLVKFHVIGQLVFGFEFFPASYANELWWLLVCMNHKMFFLPTAIPKIAYYCSPPLHPLNQSPADRPVRRSLQKDQR